MGVIYNEKSADTGEFYENAYMQFGKALSIYTNVVPLYSLYSLHKAI